MVVIVRLWHWYSVNYFPSSSRVETRSTMDIDFNLVGSELSDDELLSILSNVKFFKEALSNILTKTNKNNYI